MSQPSSNRATLSDILMSAPSRRFGAPPSGAAYFDGLEEAENTFRLLFLSIWRAAWIGPPLAGLSLSAILSTLIFYLDLRPTDLESVYTIDELRGIVLPLARERGLGGVRVFGSYARGEATPESDIDVLVDGRGARFLDICDLADGIWRASEKLADVYAATEMRPGRFRDAVLSEAVAL